MEIAIPLYDRFTALDASAPTRCSRACPDSRRDVRRRPRPAPTRPTTACSRSWPRPRSTTSRDPDILCVPGGWGTREAMSRRAPRRLDPRRARDQPVDDVGLHRVAAAGRRRRARRPRRHDATGSSSRRSREMGATPDRAARRRAGQGRSPPPACRRASTWRSSCWRRSPGDEFAQTIQLLIEYDPQPPFDAGSTEQGAAGDRRADAGAGGRAYSRPEAPTGRCGPRRGRSAPRPRPGRRRRGAASSKRSHSSPAFACRK